MPPAEAAGLKIPCPTPQHLQAELDALIAVLEPPEREDTWEKFEKGIIRFAGVTRGGGYKHQDLFVRGVGIKGVGLRIVDCMMSDRGRLSGVSTDLLQTMAPRLASHFAPLLHLYLPPLVRLLARPNKVYFKRAEKCLSTIIQHCPLPAILVYLRNGLDDRSDQCKRASAIGIESTIIQWAAPRWSDKDLNLLELCVTKMATDRDNEVRKTGKRVWAQFCDLWPERVEAFTDPLTPTIRRYLDIPADGGPSKPKPRPALRPKTAAPAPARAEPEASTRSHDLAPAHGPAGSKTRSAPRNPSAEQRHRVPSGHSTSEASESHLTRSTSYKVLSHASSSSSLGRSDAARHPVLSKPSRPGQQGKAKEQLARDDELSSSRRRLPPSRAASQSSDVRDAEPRQTHSAVVARPALRALRQAVSAESMAYALTSATAPAVEEPSLTPKSTVKERVSEFEKKVGEGTPTGYRLSPSKQDLARAAAVPLPEDSPVAAKKPLPPSRPHAPDSPSLAMLLNRQSYSDDMPTLLDLSLSDMTVVGAPSDSPVQVAKRQLSQTLREPSPSPGSVAQLIGRFSKSPTTETPNKTTPTCARASSSPLSMELTSTPTSTALSRQTSRLSAEPTGPEASPSSPALLSRRISPLPKRASAAVPELENEDEGEDESPNRSLKRKGSDIELSFTASTPVARSKVAPRFSQPLVAFGDTPIRRQSMRPFVFGASGGFFDDLMGIQNGEGDEEAHEGMTQMAEGLVIDTPTLLDEPVGFDDTRFDDAEEDLLGSFAPAALPHAMPVDGVNLLDFDDTVMPTAAEVAAAVEAMVEQKADVTLAAAPPTVEDALVTIAAVVRKPSAEPTVEAAPAPAAEEQDLIIDIDELERALAVTSVTDSLSVNQVVDSNTVTPATPPAAPSPLAVEITSILAKATPAPMEAILATDVAPSAKDLSTPAAKGPVPAFMIAPVPQEAIPTDERIGSIWHEPSTSTPVSAPPPTPMKQTRAVTEQPAVAVAEEPMEVLTASPVGPEATSQAKAEHSTFSVTADPEQPTPVAETPNPPPTAPEQPPISAPPRTRRHMRNLTAPVKPTSTGARLGPPSKARPAPVGEKKSFKPVSRLGVVDSSKSAPAPARLAMATKVSQAKSASAPVPAPAPAQVPKIAPGPGPAPRAPSAASRPPSGDAGASRPPSRQPSRPASRQVSRTASPVPESSLSASTASAPSKPKLARSSNLLKPTAAAMARAAATTQAKEKEAKPTRPTTLGTKPPAARTVSQPTRPANSLSAPTAASRARAEAALPPSKRQRVKLKAPMESFKPGRRNLSKEAILGVSAPRRPRPGIKKVETFPLPGPLLGNASAHDAEETKATENETEEDERNTTLVPTAPVTIQTPTPSLAIPIHSDEARTPTTLSPLAQTLALSPASSRTDRSIDSSRSPSSPRKMRPTPSRALEPVLTPLHSSLPPTLTSMEGTPWRSSKSSSSQPDTPATAHARRISGIPASIKRSIAATPRAELGNMFAEEEVEEMDDKEEEDGLNVVRHDVSTPQGKAASLLARLSEERRALVARDANR